MGITQISNHIYGIHRLHAIQVWLVKGEEGVTLVDAGLRSMSKSILSALDQLELGGLSNILLTHGHPDHVGSLEELIKKFQVPVYAHPKEIPFLQGEKSYRHGKEAKPVLAAGLISEFPQSDSCEWRMINGLRPYYTPGHTPGHTAFYHEEDHVLLGGDLFTTRFGHLRRPSPLFTPDMPLAVASGQIVMRLKPRLLSVCHGKDIKVPHEQYDHYYLKWHR